MRELHAVEWFHIKDRGWVAAFEPDSMPEDLWDPGQMKGEKVRIDGVKYVVLGAETYCIPRSAEHPYRRSFSLLVDGEPPEDRKPVLDSDGTWKSWPFTCTCGWHGDTEIEYESHKDFHRSTR